MIYCMNIQDSSGDVVVRVVFDLHKDGVDVEGYKIRGEAFPACTIWHFIDHVAKLVDYDELGPKSKRDLDDIAGFLAAHL